MGEVKHTPGSVSIWQSKNWPFDIEFRDASGETLARFSRYATSSRQRTLEDCMEAVGFPLVEVAGIREGLARQLADLTLWASATDLLEALKSAQTALAMIVSPFSIEATTTLDAYTHALNAEQAARAAIAKATGEQA